MEEKYRTHLKTLKVDELKSIIRQLNNTVHIPVSGVKKADLIESIIRVRHMLGLKPVISKEDKAKAKAKAKAKTPKTKAKTTPVFTL